MGIRLLRQGPPHRSDVRGGGRADDAQPAPRVRAPGRSRRAARDLAAAVAPAQCDRRARHALGVQPRPGAPARRRQYARCCFGSCGLQKRSPCPAAPHCARLPPFASCLSSASSNTACWHAQWSSALTFLFSRGVHPACTMRQVSSAQGTHTTQSATPCSSLIRDEHMLAACQDRGLMCFCRARRRHRRAACVLRAALADMLHGKCGVRAAAVHGELSFDLTVLFLMGRTTATGVGRLVTCCTGRGSACTLPYPTLCTHPCHCVP